MSSTFRALLFSLAAQLLVTTCLAAGPQYQVPGALEDSAVSEPSKACGSSNFNVVGGGTILVHDCETLLQSWQDSYFNISLYRWVNAADFMPDFRIATQGTCEIAIKRLGSYNDSRADLLLIGDTDLKDLINMSIELAKVGNGTELEIVDGAMNCTTPGMDNSLNGTIYWSLRKAGDVAGFR